MVNNDPYVGSTYSSWPNNAANQLLHMYTLLGNTAPINSALHMDTLLGNTAPIHSALHVYVAFFRDKAHVRLPAQHLQRGAERRAPSDDASLTPSAMLLSSVF